MSPASQTNAEQTRSLIAGCMARIYRHGMTTTSGGNLSARDADGNLWVTPARLDKATLTADDLVGVRPTGDVFAGSQPTSELPFHLAIYRARPEFGAVVHAHPTALVAYSAAKRVPETRVLHPTFRTCGHVRLAAYAPPGTEALGKSIASQFAQGADCVVMENHGVVVAAASLQTAFQRFETLEFTAQVLLNAAQLGQPQLLSDADLRVLDAETRPWPTLSPADVDRALQQELCDFVLRGYQRKLFSSSCGTFSRRLDSQTFLISRHGIDRGSIQPQDFVRVGDGCCDPRAQPSHLALSHQAIYERHPDVQTIVSALPVCVAAHAITGCPLRTEIIPESYVVLREIQQGPYGMALADPAGLAERLSMKQPVLMLENDFTFVVGTSVVDAFDRLEVLESSAQALIQGQVLGPLDLMSTQVLNELRTAIPETYGALSRPRTAPHADG